MEDDTTHRNKRMHSDEDLVASSSFLPLGITREDDAGIPEFSKRPVQETSQEIATLEERMKVMEPLYLEALRRQRQSSSMMTDGEENPSNDFILKNARAVYKKGIEDSIVEWTSLPAPLQVDTDFAKSLSVLSTPTVHGILATLPGLARDADFWMRIIDTLEDKSNISELLESYAAPHQILSDLDVMTAACRHDPRILMLLEDQPLGLDQRFWQTLLLHGDPAALIYMPPGAQRRFPDLVVQTFLPLAEHPDSDWEVCETVCGTIAEDLWDDGMARKWLEAGLPFVSGAHPFPAHFASDQEIFLIIAGKCREEDRLQSFNQASVTLRSDKGFMQKAIELDPDLFCCTAGTPLRYDCDLALQAFAISSDVVIGWMQAELEDSDSDYDYDSAEDIRFVRWYHRRLQEMLQARDDFVQTFLCGISQSVNNTAADGSSNLTVLDQGSETSVAYKRRIAEYLGISTGKKLRQIRQAVANIQDALDVLDVE